MLLSLTTIGLHSEKCFVIANPRLLRVKQSRVLSNDRLSYKPWIASPAKARVRNDELLHSKKNGFAITDPHLQLILFFLI